jgi:HEPN domain-containing protein/predicted nucleotidyltransferase
LIRVYLQAVIRTRAIYQPKQPFRLKTSLEHLPAHKLEELQSITDAIVQYVQPQMVILFGSYSRGNWVEDRYYEDGILYEYKSDYDILVVTEHHQDMPPRLGKQVRQRIKKTEHLQTTPHIIFHDINYLNKELEEGQYFFRDILYEGTMLYTTGKFELATPKELSNKERANKANQYFEGWLNRANGHYRQYKHALIDLDYPIAIFDLHQATECYFMTILLVFTDYKPKTHEIDKLNKEVCYADARFKTVFPNQTDEEKRLFILLVKSYIDSRYKLNYSIAVEDILWLAERVNKLRELAQFICLEKIKELQG